MKSDQLPAGDWPDKKLRRFEKAWRDGVDIVDMAARFGISPSTVSHIAERRGLPQRRGTARKVPR